PKSTMRAPAATCTLNKGVCLRSAVIDVTPDKGKWRIPTVRPYSRRTALLSFCLRVDPRSTDVHLRRPPQRHSSRQRVSPECRLARIYGTTQEWYGVPERLWAFAPSVAAGGGALPLSAVTARRKNNR